MSNLLQHGVDVLKAGDKEEARKIFISFVKANPHSEYGWEWMYNVARNDKERIYCLEQISQINPGNKKAKQLLDGLLNSSQTQINSKNAKTIKNNKRLSKTNMLTNGIVVGFFVLIFCFVVTVVATQLAGHQNNVGYASPQKVTHSDPASLITTSTISPALPTMTF